MIDPRTTKDTMMGKVAANNSAWSAGGLWGSGNFERASVEINMAPTPIGPSKHGFSSFLRPETAIQINTYRNAHKTAPLSNPLPRGSIYTKAGAAECA